MASVRFRQLERRLKKLQQRFLPPVFSPIGDYSETQLDYARGFRLLVHAEMEAYLEDRCRNTANSTLNQFRLDGKPKVITLNLLSFHPATPRPNEVRLKDLYASKKKHIFDAATTSNTTYNYVLENNHGIREVNLLRMLLPLGLDPADIDPAWMSTVDTFARNRGEVAHTSIKTQQLINPQDELNTTQYILQGLEKLDALIAKL
jgi:hypothetical protein